MRGVITHFLRKPPAMANSKGGRRIRVLQINKLYYPWIGGMEKTVQQIAEGMKDKVDVEVLACQPKGRGIATLVNGVKVTKASSLGILWSMPISFSFPFLLAWKSREVDILHFHLPFPLGVLSYLLMGAKQKKIVVTYHSDIVRQKKLMRFFRPFLHRFLRRADRIIVTSPSLLESSEELQLYREKITVVPSSVDLDEVDRPVLRTFDLGVSPGEKVVLFVGRLSYYKGLEYLIEAMREIEAKLLVVGEGELRKALEERAKSLQVDSKVVFLGRVSDEVLQYCYEICDVFVLPSIEKTEAFGLVQLEAMAHGKPVVNTRLPTGVPFVSIDGETGLTVEPRNARALALAVNSLLKNEELRRRYGIQGRKRVEENFSVEKMIDRLVGVYRQLLEK